METEEKDIPSFYPPSKSLPIAPVVKDLPVRKEEKAKDDREYSRACFRCSAVKILRRPIMVPYEASEKGYACPACLPIIQKELKDLNAPFMKKYYHGKS